MERWISEILVPATGGRPSALDFHAHWTDWVLNALVENDIEPIIVPRGRTSKKQPLDVGVNSIIQNGRARRWAAAVDRAVYENFDFDMQLTEADGVRFTQSAFREDVNRDIIKKAWMAACNLTAADLRR